MINSRRMNDLEINFRVKADAWLASCREAGIDLLVINTFRDNEFQDYLYAQGRTRAGKIVTNARGGQSLHNHRKALDFCIMKDKKPDWHDMKSYRAAGELAEKCGMEWAGRWTGSLKEVGHIQAKTINKKGE